MGEKVGFFVGCTIAKRTREIYEATITTLKKLNVDFCVFGEDVCCGFPLVLSGYVEESLSNAKEIVNYFNEKGVSKVVSSCPACYRTFLEYYPKLLKKSLPFEVYHFTNFAYEVIRVKKPVFKDIPLIKVVYHDPCELGRHCQIYEEPRKLLSVVNSIQLVELELNREKSTCCGGGGLLKATFPQVAVEVAKEKILNEILPLGVKAIVTACPSCYINFKDAALEIDEEVEIYSIEEILSQAIG